MTPRRPVIGVMGSAVASAPRLADARALGRLIAREGWILLTGGRPHGVMAAASAGAAEVPGGIVVGILPDRGEAVADGVTVAIATGLGDARNAVNVLSSDVVVACGVEGAGTASEVSLALKAGVPVVLLNASPAAITLFMELGSVHTADSPEAALTVIRNAIGVSPGPAWVPA